MRGKLLKWLFYIPIVYLIMLSCFTFYKYPLLMPKNFSMVYWQNILFENPLFYKGILTSLLIGSLTAILTTIIGFMTGRAVVYHLGGFNKKIAILISIPLLIPGMILFLGMHQVLLLTPLRNSILGVVLVHTVICLPYSSNIAIAYFTGIPKEYEAISQTLGGSKRYTLKKVILPLLKPGLLMSMMISFLISNTEYFSTFLVGGGKAITLSMIMFPYIGGHDYGHGSVMGLIFIAIHVVLFMIVDRMNKNQVKAFYGGN